MSSKKNNKTAIALCIQEPTEDGSSMNFGAIEGDNLRFLHQAFITDTIINAALIPDADIRLFHIDSPDRKRLVSIVVDYLNNKFKGDKSTAFDKRFDTVELDRDRWGIRIEQVFQDCFKQGYQNVLVIGSRTPSVTTRMFTTALKMLGESDAVFGPTPDGRYYAIGMSSAYHISLSEFDWKSPKIYSEVAEAFSEKGLAWSELEIWYCVENSEDLEMLVRDINQFRIQRDEITAHETEKVLERILAKLEP